MKPHALIWEHFLPFDAEGVLIAHAKGFKKAVTAQCKHCDWCRTPNATRMKAHYDSAHANGESEADATQPLSDAPLVDPPIDRPAKRQGTLADYLDRKFTENEQYNAEMAQAFAIVMNGQSHNHMEKGWTLDFIRSRFGLHTSRLQALDKENHPTQDKRA